MRQNNIYWADYDVFLKKESITPYDEMQDVRAATTSLSCEHRQRVLDAVKVLEEIYVNGSALLGRKTITVANTAEYICVPANMIVNIQHMFPIIQESQGDGKSTVYRDIPDNAKTEIALLHWIYLELEAVDRRIKAGEKY